MPQLGVMLQVSCQNGKNWEFCVRSLFRFCRSVWRPSSAELHVAALFKLWVAHECTVTSLLLRLVWGFALLLLSNKVSFCVEFECPPSAPPPPPFLQIWLNLIHLTDVASLRTHIVSNHTAEKVCCVYFWGMVVWNVFHFSLSNAQEWESSLLPH